MGAEAPAQEEHAEKDDATTRQQHLILVSSVAGRGMLVLYLNPFTENSMSFQPALRASAHCCIRNQEVSPAPSCELCLRRQHSRCHRFASQRP